MELLARTERNGWVLDWLTFDEGYGSTPGFLQVLDVTAQRYVGEVPKAFACRPGGSRANVSAEAVFSWPGVTRRAARSFRIAHQTGPAAVWQAKAVAVAVALGNDPRPRHRLILARNRETGEIKYFLTNAPRQIGLPHVLRAAFVRWNVEHVFRVAKGDVGLTHFKGRSYVSLKRHLALCLVAVAFVSLHTRQLRGEKSRGHGGASVPGAGADLPELSEPPPSHDRDAMRGGHPPVSAGPKRGRRKIEEETTATT